MISCLLLPPTSHLDRLSFLMEHLSEIQKSSYGTEGLFTHISTLPSTPYDKMFWCLDRCKSEKREELENRHCGALNDTGCLEDTVKQLGSMQGQGAEEKVWRSRNEGKDLPLTAHPGQGNIQGAPTVVNEVGELLQAPLGGRTCMFYQNGRNCEGIRRQGYQRYQNTQARQKVTFKIGP